MKARYCCAKKHKQMCTHGRVICSSCVVVTDAARRMSDAVNLAVKFGEDDIIGGGAFMAFALADGSTDHTLYPTKAAAIAHQSNEFLYCYLSLRRCPGGLQPKDAQIWLDLHRHVYDHGGRLADPDSPDMIMPQAREQMITRPVVPRLWVPGMN